MQSQNMNEMIDAMNGYFRAVTAASPLTCEDKLFTCTIDSAVSEGNSYDRLQFWTAYGQLLVFNFLEYLKSNLKSRIPAFRRVAIVKTVAGGRTHINFHNGTAIVFDANHVWKFYFKDTEYFSAVYRELAKLIGYDTDKRDGFFVTIQPRHNSVTSLVNDVDILLAVQPFLATLHRAARESARLSDLLQPQKKVRQLIMFYKQLHNEYSSSYVQLGQAIEKKSAPFGKVICHGDLWIDNIVETGDCSLSLIDYDKMVLFASAYDYVYYFLMSRILSRRFRIEQLIIHIAHYAVMAADYFRNDCKGALGEFSDTEIKHSIYLFALLKLVEQDMRHERYGESLGLLHKGLSAL